MCQGGAGMHTQTHSSNPRETKHVVLADAQIYVRSHKALALIKIGQSPWPCGAVEPRGRHALAMGTARLWAGLHQAHTGPPKRTVNGNHGIPSCRREPSDQKGFTPAAGTLVAKQDPSESARDCRQLPMTAGSIRSRKLALGECRKRRTTMRSGMWGMRSSNRLTPAGLVAAERGSKLGKGIGVKEAGRLQVGDALAALPLLRSIPASCPRSRTRAWCHRPKGHSSGIGGKLTGKRRQNAAPGHARATKHLNFHQRPLRQAPGRTGVLH